ncbi:thioredoxin family protein [Streptomyces radiopugnans]|uniref:Thioredoxin 1 n=1 Tax=Streptomyces radiopugnans TaxID=403935 RepID=A0A1H9JFA1_9ACTN|nr:thioredoxin family protein [Streptomyces radiopugnans]SEQ85449.1 thioredoxin 1 [Streptomyces radiopugnans]
MSTIEPSADNLNEAISGNDLVVIDFRAERCEPCRKSGPVFEQVSGEHEGVVSAKADAEARRDLAQAFETRSVPTLVIVREQVAVFRRAGALKEHPSRVPLA